MTIQKNKDKTKKIKEVTLNPFDIWSDVQVKISPKNFVRCDKHFCSNSSVFGRWDFELTKSMQPMSKSMQLEKIKVEARRKLSDYWAGDWEILDAFIQKVRDEAYKDGARTQAEMDADLISKARKEGLKDGKKKAYRMTRSKLWKAESLDELEIYLIDKLTQNSKGNGGVAEVINESEKITSKWVSEGIKPIKKTVKTLTK